MKRINVQKDIESRQKIATQVTNPIINNQNVEDAKSTEVQGDSIDTQSDTTAKDTTQKGARTTKRNTKKV